MKGKRSSPSHPVTQNLHTPYKHFDMSPYTN